MKTGTKNRACVGKKPNRTREAAEAQVEREIARGTSRDRLAIRQTASGRPAERLREAA